MCSSLTIGRANSIGGTLSVKGVTHVSNNLFVLEKFTAYEPLTLGSSFAASGNGYFDGELSVSGNSFAGSLLLFSHRSVPVNLYQCKAQFSTLLHSQESEVLQVLLTVCALEPVHRFEIRSQWVIPCL